MNWELILALGSVGAALVMGVLYARAARKAALVDQYKRYAEHMSTVLKSARQVVATKEKYIRELQRTLLGSMPASELVDRLGELFAEGGREAGPVPPAKRAPGATGA